MDLLSAKIMGFGKWSFWGIGPAMLADAMPEVGAFPWGSITATGLLIWHCWYVTCKERPRRDAEIRSQIDDHTARYEKILDRRDEQHRENMDKKEVMHKEAVDKLCESFGSWTRQK